MSTLRRFDFQELPFRVAMMNGEPWFFAVDVCNALDIDNATQALTRLDPDERTLISNEGRSVNAVSEAGLYSIILGSRKPEAKAFKRWVTHEVLPSIRATGSYSVAPALDPTSLDGVALILEAANTALAKVKELTPKAEAWDELAGAEGDYEVADAAKILARAGVQTGRQRLFGQLESIGWIFRGSSGKWKARQYAVDDGYLAEKPQSHHHPRTGELVLDPPQVRVTVRGLERLRVRLGGIETLEKAS